MEFFFAKIAVIDSLFATDVSKKEFYDLGLKSKVSSEFKGFEFMFADVSDKVINKKEFIYGRLNKYGETSVERMNEDEQITEDVILESGVIGFSHFVIFPYENVLMYNTNKNISNPQFLARFEDIFNKAIIPISVTIQINPIKDNYSFYEKLQELKEIKEISLAIVPTNPNPSEIIKAIDAKLKAENLRQKTITYLGKPGGIKLDEEIKDNTVYTDIGYGRGRAIGIDQNGKTVKIYSKKLDKQRKSSSIAIDDGGVYGLIEKLAEQIEQKKIENENKT